MRTALCSLSPRDQVCLTALVALAVSKVVAVVGLGEPEPVELLHAARVPTRASSAETWQMVRG